MKWLLVLAGILIGVSAFFYFHSHTPEVPSHFAAALPGRDEVCLSGSIRLSMNSYEAIQRRFPGMSSIDQVRVGLYGQWLGERASKQDSQTLSDAAQCVRAVMKPRLSPAEIQEADVLLSQRFGFSSLSELEIAIHDAWGSREIEWNRSLVMEYRIEIPESIGKPGN